MPAMTQLWPALLLPSVAGVDLAHFHAFSPLHWLTLAVCVLAIIFASALGHKLRLRPNATAELRWRHLQGWFCLVIYTLYVAWLMLPRNFSWPESLPLEFCDAGLLVAAGALLGKKRWLRGLLYFWAFVFTSQAFATPVLQKGPATPEFWLFWCAHLAILNAAVYDLAVGKFRPAFEDATRSYVISFFYATALLILDNLTGWNYGYVGPSKPGATTLIDALGGYPLRLLWMLLIAAAGFALAWLPWLRRKN